MKKISLLFIISLFINGVFGDKDERVSVNDGDAVTLHAHLTDIQSKGVIVWRFNGERIARINREVNDTPVYDTDKRFTDRLKMNPQTGDLTITHITSEHTGEYKLEIDADILTNTFSVKVSGRFSNDDDKDDGSSKGPSSGVIAVICVGLLLVIVAVVIYRRHIKKRLDPKPGNQSVEINEPLRNGDANDNVAPV